MARRQEHQKRETVMARTMTMATKARTREPAEEGKRLTFGDFIEATYRACGKRKATGIVRLAVNARLVEFLGGQRFVISEPEPQTSQSL